MKLLLQHAIPFISSHLGIIPSAIGSSVLTMLLTEFVRRRHTVLPTVKNLFILVLSVGAIALFGVILIGAAVLVVTLVH
ncbi:MAG TPA: hypothetical protein VLK33_09000 [Terriglobales bacterium]|nr:hypothetical protein [Terriglobales bacterium]